jgi:hypothetical protein
MARKTRKAAAMMAARFVRNSSPAPVTIGMAKPLPTPKPT